ncbi:hypothetical protein [Dyella telluris]|uniref:LuxR family transcriptional regulator n=1 Tax=Dyella telluris TaxID=2763498 RepID=A0A7G8Q3P8_9GAMM|nr:hypothetical protein [Dyella telluris]QNK01406.1 hypothetical protein H8F01_20595 [Dyella telluris]
MKLFPRALICVSVLALASAATLADVTTPLPGSGVPRPAGSRLLGNWSLDTSRMPVPAGQRPRSVGFSFSRASDHALTLHVDIVHANGEEVHSVGTAVLDGSVFVIKDSPEADTGAMKQPAPNVLVLALQKEGTLVSTRVYSVMPDDHTLVETAVYPGKDGQPVLRTNYFTRTR